MLETAPKTVAVVDFDPAVRHQCRAMLEGEGFRVELGATRSEAVELLNRMQPDLLIIGVFLADGPAWRIFESGALGSVPVVGLTDVVQGATSRRLLKERYAFLELLDKPLSAANLIDLMRVHFGPSYPHTPSSHGVDDGNRGRGEIEAETAVRRTGPHFAAVLQDDGYVVDASVLSDEHTSVRDSVDESEDSAFPRVSTAQTSRPASTSLVPSSIDWRTIPEEGNLAHVSFPALLARMIHTRATGSLRLWRQRVRKIVFVQEGRPVSVRSNLLYECLGNVMVRLDFIDQETSESSIAQAMSEGRRQGEVLVSAGAITQDELAVALRTQLEERILDVFGWSEARYHLHQTPGSGEVVAPTRDETRALVVRGVLDRAPADRIVAELESCLPLNMRLTADPGVTDGLGLSEAHGGVLDELRRGCSLLELVARYEQAAQVYQVTYALLVLGYITLEE